MTGLLQFYDTPRAATVLYARKKMRADKRRAGNVDGNRVYFFSIKGKQPMEVPANQLNHANIQILGHIVKGGKVFI